MSSTPHKSSRGLGLPIVATAGLASVMLAFSLTPTFSQVVGSITNSTNTAGAGYLQMTVTGSKAATESGEGAGTGSATCVSSDSASNDYASCASINEYGNNFQMTPGVANAVTESITIENSGTIAATSFVLTPGVCSVTATVGLGTAATTGPDTLCAHMKVQIESGEKSIFVGTLDALAAGGPINLLPKLGSSSVPADSLAIPVTFTVWWESSGSDKKDNTYQGQNVLQSLKWTFNA